METNSNQFSYRSTINSFTRKLFLFVFIGYGLITTTAFGQNTSIYFKSDKSNLDEKATANLDAILKFISKHPGGQLIISGHTDSDADERYNNELSQKRVNSVIAYLKSHANEKLPEIDRSALGESKPVSSNATEAEKAFNRRVEISYIYVDQPVAKEELKKGDIKDLYALLLPEFDEHCIDNTRDTFLVCAKGTILSIPADAFTRTTAGCVNISVREALSKSDMLLQNLNTQGDQGLLISGGMLEIKASDDKGELILKRDKKLIGLLPTDNVLENANAYYGTRDNTHQQNINWHLPKGTLQNTAILPFDYWMSCWQSTVSNNLYCERCNIFCRIGRIDEGIAGITDSATHISNKEFRNCQYERRHGRANKKTTYFPPYCYQVTSQLQSLGIIPDSAYFMNIYGKFMKENGIKTIAEAIESLNKNEKEREKINREMTKEFMRKDSIRRVGYNAIGIAEFGNINFDYFLDKKDIDQLMKVKTDLPYDQDVDCKLIFTEINSIMYGYSSEDKIFYFDGIPIGETVWLMALKFDGRQPYLFLKQMKTGEPVPPIVFEALSIEQIKEKMKSVDL